MSQPLQPTNSIEIGGRTFTVSRLPLGRARVVYARLQRVLQAVFADDAALAGDTSAIMFAGIAGGISETDFKFYCDEFGAVTRVELSPQETVLLKSEAAQERVFGAGGDFADQFTWLDFAIRVNFASSIEKMRGALVGLKQRAEEAMSKAGQSPSLPG